MGMSMGVRVGIGVGVDIDTLSASHFSPGNPAVRPPGAKSHPTPEAPSVVMSSPLVPFILCVCYLCVLAASPAAVAPCH